MEFFLVLGGLISLPVIKYCTKPAELLNTKDLEEEEGKKEEKKENKEEAQISAKRLEEYKKRSQIRKEKILSELTPYERELFLDYIQELKNPKPGKSFEGCLTFFGLLFFTLILILIAYILLTTQTKQKTSDL